MPTRERRPRDHDRRRKRKRSHDEASSKSPERDSATADPAVGASEKIFTLAKKKFRDAISEGPVFICVCCTST